MTVKEFEHYNNFGIMPQGWIGQGTGYKATWDETQPDDIIYIPENAYEEYDGHRTVNRENAYSVNDFINICNGNVKRARELFYFCDWQFPNYDDCFGDEDEEPVTEAFHNEGYEFMDELIKENGVDPNVINNNYTLKQVLNEYLTYEGIIGYTDRIMDVINTYRQAKGEEYIS